MDSIGMGHAATRASIDWHTEARKSRLQRQPHPQQQQPGQCRPSSRSHSRASPHNNESRSMRMLLLIVICGSRLMKYAHASSSSISSSLRDQMTQQTRRTSRDLKRLRIASTSNDKNEKRMLQTFNFYFSFNEDEAMTTTGTDTELDQHTTMSLLLPSSTHQETSNPTESPTSLEPTLSPSYNPSTSEPTNSPSSSSPTMQPSTRPSTQKPTESPTSLEPTLSPSYNPSTSVPTYSPSTRPTTQKPTESPTSLEPTLSPSYNPSTSEPANAPEKVSVDAEEIEIAEFDGPLTDFIVTSVSRVDVPTDNKCTDPSEGLWTMELSTDSYPWETAYTVKDEKGEVVLAGPPEGRNYARSTKYLGSLCMPTGQYLLEVTDKGEDGICCEYGNGYMVIKVNGKTVAMTGDSDFSSFKRYITVEEAGTGTSNPTKKPTPASTTYKPFTTTDTISTGDPTLSPLYNPSTTVPTDSSSSHHPTISPSKLSATAQSIATVRTKVPMRIEPSTQNPTASPNKEQPITASPSIRSSVSSSLQPTRSTFSVQASITLDGIMETMDENSSAILENVTLLFLNEQFVDSMEVSEVTLLSQIVVTSTSEKDGDPVFFTTPLSNSSLRVELGVDGIVSNWTVFESESTSRNDTQGGSNDSISTSIIRSILMNYSEFTMRLTNESDFFPFVESTGIISSREMDSSEDKITPKKLIIILSGAASALVVLVGFILFIEKHQSPTQQLVMVREDTSDDIVHQVERYIESFPATGNDVGSSSDWEPENLSVAESLLECVSDARLDVFEEIFLSRRQWNKMNRGTVR